MSEHPQDEPLDMDPEPGGDNELELDLVDPDASPFDEPWGGLLQEGEYDPEPLVDPHASPFDEPGSEELNEEEA